MCGSFGIAQQHDIVFVPYGIGNNRKVPPVRFVGDQSVAVEFFFKKFGQLLDGIFFIFGHKTCLFPRLWRSLEYPGTFSFFVLVGMRHDRAVRRISEKIGKGIQRTGRAHPNKLVFLECRSSAEIVWVLVAYGTVDAVTGYDHVRILKL
ncbi:hypothetical protein D3C86_1285490 [compost metagenome]